METALELIGEAIAMGHLNANELTDREFYRRHPELEGTKLETSDGRLSEEWTEILHDLVQPALAQSHPVPLRTKRQGFEGSFGGPLVDKLKQFRSENGLVISDDDIDLLHRIAAVESSGQLTSINTWDGGVLSAGFMQWTLRHGELTKWISRAREAFARYGIELDRGFYVFGSDKYPAIKGASDPNELRQRSWAERFAHATLDREIVIAEVRHALDVVMPGQRQRLEQHVEGVVPGGWERIGDHYNRSSLVRALFLEAFNNCPVCAVDAALSLARALPAEASDEAFVSQLVATIQEAYSLYSDKDQGVSLTRKVQNPSA